MFINIKGDSSSRDNVVTEGTEVRGNIVVVFILLISLDDVQNPIFTNVSFLGLALSYLSMSCLQLNYACFHITLFLEKLFRGCEHRNMMPVNHFVQSVMVTFNRIVCSPLPV